jgi:putative membrane protein
MMVAVMALAGAQEQQTQQQETQQQETQQQQTQQTEQQGQPMRAMNIDEAFVMAAAHNDMYEIMASDVAAERTTNDAISNFAERMIIDHTTNSARLMELASEMGMNMEMMGQMGMGEMDQMMMEHMMALPAMHQLKLAQLSNLQGEEFDRAYVKQQVIGHMAAISLYQIEAQSGQDEQLRMFATQALPVLQAHLAAAMDLMQQMGMNMDDMMMDDMMNDQGGGSN